jgi:glycerol-3-phosphate dehydrogenase
VSSSPPDPFDVVVIGDSITGHLSALALAERGLRVALCATANRVSDLSNDV